MIRFFGYKQSCSTEFKRRINFSNGLRIGLSRGQPDGENQVSVLKFEGLSTAESVFYQFRQVIKVPLI